MIEPTEDEDELEGKTVVATERKHQHVILFTEDGSKFEIASKITHDIDVRFKEKGGPVGTN